MADESSGTSKKIQIKDSTQILYTINALIYFLSALGFCYIIFTAKTCVSLYSDGTCEESQTDTVTQALAFAGILYASLIAFVVIVFIEHVRRSMIIKESSKG